MELSQATALIRHPSLNARGPAAWADLGCSDGFFTNALSTFLQPASTVYALDTNAQALKRVKVSPSVNLQISVCDFVKDGLPFEKLDGIMMANSLHYVKNKETFLIKVKKHLNENGLLLIVEYDTDTANPWVSHPISYASLQKLLPKNGFSSVEKLNQMPSAFGRANIYAALVKI